MKQKISTCFLLFAACQYLYTPLAAQYQQPQWRFPLYFEAGDGQKDTLEFGYDPLVGQGSWDSLFGIFPEPVDSSKFRMVFIEGGGYCMRKALSNSTNNGHDIYTQGTVSRVIPSMQLYPLKISWDGFMLNDTNLPFQNIVPNAPRAVLLLFCWHGNGIYDAVYCDDQIPYVRLLSNPSGLYSFQQDHILSGDSFVIPGDPDSSFSVYKSGFDIYITPYEEQYFVPIKQRVSELFEVFPNPFNASITMSGTFSGEYHISICSFDGKEIDYSNPAEGSSVVRINTEELISGIYFLFLRDERGTILFSQKIIKY